MHKKPFKIDKQATKAAKFHSRYSYVSQRIHPQSDPPHQCQYLAGLEDIGQRRSEVFERDQNRCTDCGKRLGLVADYDTGGSFLEVGHLAHGGHTKVSRCWCLENLSTKCHQCHRDNDHHGRDF